MIEVFIHLNRMRLLMARDSIDLLAVRALDYSPVIFDEKYRLAVPADYGFLD